MPKPWTRIAHALLGAIAIAGCGAIGPAPGIADFDFRVRGKIAVRGVESPFAATFDWRQAGRRFEIDLWGAMGQGRVRLGGNERELEITDSRGRTTRGLDAELLMQRELGWAAPAGALPYWMRGKRHPAAPASPLGDREDDASGFEQFGWTIAVSAWGKQGGRRLPQRLVVSRGERRLVIVCKEWIFPAA